MLLTITTTHRPATDLGFLLNKNPDRLHEVELSFGHARMFYPEASEERCRFALVMDVDPVKLVRGSGKSGGERGGQKGKNGGLFEHYVNDRPYAASSLLSVAIVRGLRTALSGRSNERAELAQTAIPLEATVVPLACRGAETLVEKVFAPLGYEIEIEPAPLDEAWPQWGPSAYVKLTLRATCRVSELLNHLYVLIPVLDRNKHYYVHRDELEKLLAKGQGWLADHPEKELIARRYLTHRRELADEALARLVGEETTEAELDTEAKDTAEEALEKPLNLHDLRLDTVARILAEAGVRRVADLGCGEGKLLKRLLSNPQFEQIIGIDVSTRSLEIAERRLKLERLPERQRERIRLLQGALTYRDQRIEGLDACALVEVIEHLDADRLPAMERALFEFARPRLVIITTPNREYNARFENMGEGQLRHGDHRFEWTRAEFEAWAMAAAERFGYGVRLLPLGPEDDDLGAPSQMAIFERKLGDR